MAISTTYQKIEEKFNPRYWDSIEEFEEYYLRELSERLPDTNYYTDSSGEEIKIPPINHFPELKEYEVWVEGFAATGQRAGATLLGKVKARNFAQACHIIMCESHLKHMKEENKPTWEGYTTPGRWDYDPHNLTHWGCKMFWNEKLAKKSFG